MVGTTFDNAAFPGPIITAMKDDRFLLNVINELSDPTMLRSTSIHWHGLNQRGSSWADGPASVTQCPISPSRSFLYDFHAHGQAGTFWYHSHLSTQYCDGLRGALVIYDPHDPHKHLYDIDNGSTVITLADWYHTPGPSLGPRPISNATIINGKGRYFGGPESPLSVIRVKPGVRYRFRLVAMSCDPNYTFSIDGHTLTVIEADGISVEPVEVDSIQIFAGQRYSFVLHANQHADNYWVRANPNIGFVGFEGGLNLAVLHYANVEHQRVHPSYNATPAPEYVSPLLETDLHPLINPGAPGEPTMDGADVKINMAISLDQATSKFFVNGRSFVPPTAPVLLQILSGARSPMELMPGGSVYKLPPNKVIELTIPGGSPGSPHPIHLHGHTFDVVRSAGSSVYNYENPVRRDVVSSGFKGDNVTIRFKTDNAGPWVMHCHIDFHFDAGLAVVFAEEDFRTWDRKGIPVAWSELCPTYYGLSEDETYIQKTDRY